MSFLFLAAFERLQPHASLCVTIPNRLVLGTACSCREGMVIGREMPKGADQEHKKLPSR